MPFIHSTGPVLFHIGSTEIRYYGLVYVLGFIIAFIYLYFLKKNGKLDLKKEEIFELIVYNMVGLIIGSKLFEAFICDPGYYLQSTANMMSLLKGGNSFHGGLIGLVAATWLFCRKKDIRGKVSFARMIDHISIPAMSMVGFAKIANFINGELVGRITSVPWCFYFPGHDGCRHPQQLYSAARAFAVSGWLIFLNMKKHKAGFIFWNLVTFYGLTRFLLDFFREDATFLGLSTGQYLSIVMLLLGGFVLLKYYKNDLVRIFSKRAVKER